MLMNLNKHIPLTQGKFAIVDAADYAELSKYKWRVKWCKNVKSFYVIRSLPRVNGKSKVVTMHREILGALPGQYVDHINHDTLDNRRENLRICTNAQNCANRIKSVNTSSQFKGVYWCKVMSKWRSRIGEQPQHIGYFTDEIEAARAYDEAAKELFGEFALLNFPEGNR